MPKMFESTSKNKDYPIELPDEYKLVGDYEFHGPIADSYYLLYYKPKNTFRLLKLWTNSANSDAPETPRDWGTKEYFAFEYFPRFHQYKLGKNDRKNIWYEIEFIPCGSLQLYINYMSSHDYNESNLQTLIIIMNLLFALSVLHNNDRVPIVHRNINPNDIFLSYDKVFNLFIPFIVGYGNSRVVPNNTQMTKQSPDIYVAPETIKENNDYTVLSDVYSLGLVIYALIQKKDPISKDSQHLKDDILKGISEQDIRSLKPEIYSDLLINMLNPKDPNSRKPAKNLVYELCNHVHNDLNLLEKNELFIFLEYFNRGILELENLHQYGDGAKILRKEHGSLEEVLEIKKMGVAPWLYQKEVNQFIDENSTTKLNCSTP